MFTHSDGRVESTMVGESLYDLLAADKSSICEHTAPYNITFPLSIGMILRDELLSHGRFHSICADEKVTNRGRAVRECEFDSVIGQTGITGQTMSKMNGNFGVRVVDEDTKKRCAVGRG